MLKYYENITNNVKKVWPACMYLFVLFLCITLKQLNSLTTINILSNSSLDGLEIMHQTAVPVTSYHNFYVI